MVWDVNYGWLTYFDVFIASSNYKTWRDITIAIEISCTVFLSAVGEDVGVFFPP